MQRPFGDGCLKGGDLDRCGHVRLVVRIQSLYIILKHVFSLWKHSSCCRHLQLQQNPTRLLFKHQHAEYHLIFVHYNPAHLQSAEAFHRLNIEFYKKDAPSRSKLEITTECLEERIPSSANSSAILLKDVTKAAAQTTHGCPKLFPAATRLLRSAGIT